MERDQLFKLLDQFDIETPSWGYADTGTRFGKFLQAAAASTIDEKLADAGTVHRYTGCCPTVAVHVLWDFSMGVDATATADVAARNGDSHRLDQSQSIPGPGLQIRLGLPSGRVGARFMPIAT